VIEAERRRRMKRGALTMRKAAEASSVETDSLLCRPGDVDGGRTILVRALLRISGQRPKRALGRFRPGVAQAS
jgi:hypothetical protein